jgi:hypothetical protein
MGVSMSRMLAGLFGTGQIYLLTFGLEGAGKRSMYYDLSGFGHPLDNDDTKNEYSNLAIISDLKLSPVSTTTIGGVPVETTQYKNIVMTVYNVGGGKTPVPPLPSGFKGITSPPCSLS